MTSAESRLARNTGKESKLSYSAHALMENRNDMLVDFRVEPADGFAERRAALCMLKDSAVKERRITLAGDKRYDIESLIRDDRDLKVTPHVAQTSDYGRRSAIDARTTRHPGYAVSQKKGKRTKEIFGWMKTVGNFRRTGFKGLRRTQMAATFVAAAYNLLRIGRLTGATA